MSFYPKWGIRLSRSGNLQSYGCWFEEGESMLTIISLPVGMMPDEVVDARLGSLPLRECCPLRLISAVKRLRRAVDGGA